MKNHDYVDLVSMRPEDVVAAVDLIATAMNADEGQWAKETFDFYFACQQHRMDSGRQYYVFKKNESLIGLAGLHHYVWGPADTVWLSWFAVLPEYQGRGVGTAMLAAAEEKAKQSGFKKFFIETYDGPAFERACAFYQSRGFSECGHIRDYLPGGESMRVFKKDL